MKKTLLLIASAAMLLVGCAKEKLSIESGAGEMVTATFTASLDKGVATKAVADGDGAAVNVNRCIMEIYYGDELFTRKYAPVGSDKKASFTTQIVSNRTYKVAFWADMVGDTTTNAGLATDKYYTTTSLKEVAIKGNYIGNDDARDAFYHVGQYTIAQAGSSFGDIKLKRPFAQMNVITTDWDKASSATGLAPEKVKVTLKNALVKFNAVTEEASGSENLEYEAAVYTAPDPVDPVSTTEKTLSMDYLFASADKAVIDIDWKALHGTDANVEHAFAAVPYQRNYRTNIKGALLTTHGQWTVTVDPIWELDPNGDFDYAYTSVYDIQGANDFVAQNQDKKEISVTFSTQPNDAGDPSEGTDEHPINAIVTSLLKQGATYNIDVASTTDMLYVGDYDYLQEGGSFTYNYAQILPENSEKTNAAAVNLVVTDNLYIGTLVVNSPSKSVSINGQTVQSGKTYHIENLQVQEVSMNTVIIESGMVVDNLEMKKGGLEIHGTVHKATVPEGTPIADIKVRDCENLDEELVYNVLKNYIAEGYVGVKGRTTAGKWDIIPWICKIENTGYGSLADAVAAVQSGETITLVRDYEGDGVVVPGGKNFTLDFGGHTYKVIDNMAGSTGTKNQCFQLLKGSTLVFQNGTITTSCAKLGINTYSDIKIKDLTIDMTGTEAAGQVACLETCNGNVSIEGNTNLIAKEGQIATLVLYWPNGGYGDINLTINTTGEVSGLMAYGSYQVQDLSTVAQHSHVAIKNGKYDVAFDMDGLESYDYVISGGVFTNKPADEIVADKYIVVENEDAVYPWKVEINPENAEVSITKSGEATVYSMLADFRDKVNAGNSYEGYTVTLLKDVAYSSSNYWTPIGCMNADVYFAGIFDGNNHKVEGLNIDTEQLGESPDYWPGGFFGYTRGAKIKNLSIYGKTDCAGMVGYAEYTDISDCESHMDSELCYNISGGFIAHADAYVTLSNCKNYGNFICKTSANYAEVGGIVGRFYGGDHCSVTNCENYGDISWEGENGGGAQRSLGGIVAGFYNASAISNPQKCVISGCKNFGTIFNKNATSGTTTSTTGGIGGIVGKPFLQGNGIGVTISNCTNSGNIVSSGRAGGIVGALNEAWQNVGKYSTVSGCTNTGTIYGTDGSRGQIYGIMGTNASDPDKENVLSNNQENGTLKTYDEYTN